MHGLPVLGLATLLLWATTAADAQQQGRPAVVDGLPDMIPIQLLLGNAKYRNPQVRTQTVCIKCAPASWTHAAAVRQSGSPSHDELTDTQFMFKM
jgi:hypothetical protein